MIKISVVIPCYNAEKYIEECLESVFNQTIGIENMQIILIDDASTDGTLEHLMSYEQRYPENVLLYVLEENQGQANARNIGIENAIGEYIAFVDADDWLEPDMYECLYQIAVQTKADLIQANYFEHLDGDVKLAFDNEELGFYQLDTIEDKNAFWGKHNMQSIWAGIYRTELFNNKEIRFRHYVKYEDNFFSGIVQYAINSYYLAKKAFYHYRIHETSNSHNRNDENHFIRLEVELEKLKYYQLHGIFNLYYKNIRKAFLENFYGSTIHIMFCKFDNIYYDKIVMMQQIVRELFPDYLEYYKESGKFVSMILTVAFDFPIDEWEKIKDAYLDWLQNGQQDKIVKMVCSMKQALNI